MLVESRILGFGIGSTAQGIRNPSIDWIPESKFHWQRLDPLPGIRDPQRGVQNPRLSWIPLYGLITRPGKIEIHYKTSCTKGHYVLKPTLSHSDNFLFGFFKEKRRKKYNGNESDTPTAVTKPSFVRQRCTVRYKRELKHKSIKIIMKMFRVQLDNHFCSIFVFFTARRTKWLSSSSKTPFFWFQGLLLALIFGKHKSCSKIKNPLT